MDKERIGPKPLLLPMPVVIVGVTVNRKPSFIMATGCNVALLKPLAFTVALEKDQCILEGINKQGIFSINVPSIGLIEKVDYCSISSGGDKDQSKFFNTFYGTLEGAPLIEECPLNHECKATHNLDLSTHLLVVGEVIETHVDKRCLAYGALNIEKVMPVFTTYTLVSKQYRQLGKVVGKSFYIGKKERGSGICP